MPDPAIGPILIQRLHRLVRHGYRPWLGYDAASGLDGDIDLHRRDGNATLRADGAVVLTDATIPGDDPAAFDARFPPNTPNKRNLMRRLYEIGFMSGV